MVVESCGGLFTPSTIGGETITAVTCWLLAAIA